MHKGAFNRRGFHRRLGLALTNFLPFAVAASDIKSIPTVMSLQDELAIAAKQAKPLLVFVSLDNCPYCKIARENYLIPLMNEQSIPVVQVNFRHVTPILDAQGHKTTQDQLIRAWGVKVAPTLLFLGRKGQEVAPRLVGGATSDFYGAYLTERIHSALVTMK